ncbi:Rhomboid-like protease 3 [Symbiodinium microadriaticum]|uniref:Rhomboid-like protease n=1 Tax=Symbiodinium microadriaticum TaxID=2951 RepID=A0A1Q9CN30_SYMMI|nr:Rhomboid-like protease 3 [Symbiodinium microadriaticum]
MTCIRAEDRRGYNLHRKSDRWRLPPQQKLADTLIKAGQETLDSRLRRGLVWPLVKGILNFKGGLSSEMLTWAFEHEDGKNPFCQMASEERKKRNELLEHFAHLLVSGAAESDKKPDEGSALVLEGLSQLIQKAIVATTMADCGMFDNVTDSRRLKWDTNFTWPPVVLNSFELLAQAPPRPRERYFVQSLVDLFQDYVKKTGVDLFNSEIPPEMERLWSMLHKDGVTSEEGRVFARAEEQVRSFSPNATRPMSCQCHHVAAAMASAMGKHLKEVGFDPSSAEADWVWKATDVSEMLDLFTLTEAGLEDPNLSFLYLLGEANHLKHSPVEEGEQLSEESVQRSMIKGVLVGLPMIQNYLAHLDIKHGGGDDIKQNYAAKEKWFLFLNIAWAVFHENEQVGIGELQRVSLQHRQQNVAFGLLVSAFSVLSSFSWDGINFKETNTEAFNDYNVALYTVWNYRWVRALFEPRRLQYHFWNALGLPMLEALGNQGSSAYWVNYRRDGLMASLINLSPLPEASQASVLSPRLESGGGGDAGAGGSQRSGAGADGFQASSATAQLFLGYLSALFIALRSGVSSAKPGKDQDLPLWAEPPPMPSVAAPQSLVLPRRSLSLNVLDGYDTLKLALRLLLSTVGQREAASSSRRLLEVSTIQELSICTHVGLYHTIRRRDLSERTLKLTITAIFQVGTAFLSLEADDGGPVVSIGWPVRLIEALLARSDAEPQLLVPNSRLCMEAVRNFVVETSHRSLALPDLWRAMLQLLFRAAPTTSRALWPSAKDKEVEAVQLLIWRRGLVWLLAHPQLHDGDTAGEDGAGSPSDSEANSFWGWALSELTTLAQEMAGNRGTGSIRLLLYAYRTLLHNLARPVSAAEYARDEPSELQEDCLSEAADVTGAGPCATGQDLSRASKAAAWSRVAVAMINFVGPAVGRPNAEEPDLQVLPLLKQSLLHARIPSLLASGNHGPFWARSVLEKLVSVLTGPVTSGAPLTVVREAVSLVSKFFLQNLQTLQRHESFGQLWLMVLRLMLQFIKRGSDDRDAELEEVSTENLKNLLGVLVSTSVLGFVSPKAAQPSDAAARPVWWQMTWDCIEVFIPGFGEDFSRSVLGTGAAEILSQRHALVDLCLMRGLLHTVASSHVPFKRGLGTFHLRTLLAEVSDQGSQKKTLGGFLQCSTISCRSTEKSSYTFEDAALALGLTAGLGAAAASTALAPGAALLKMAMMIPTPPPPSLAPPAPPLAAATQGRTNALIPAQTPPGPPQFSLLDALLPNFNTDTFIWRVSMLQITEYIGSLLLGSAYGSPKLCSLYLLGASWGPAIAQGAVWRLMLPMMLHANALHIFFNLFFQMRIGFGMEKQFGRRKFCLLYMFCGFLGNLISVAVDPMKLAVGASTSGFGLLGVWAAEVLLTWDLLGESRSRVFLWFAFMVTSCIMMSTISPNVDFVGHFAGMLAGFLLAIILADMQEEHQPAWYDKAKMTAKNITALIVIASLVRAITLGPDGPIPYCGTIFHPRRLPF